MSDTQKKIVDYTVVVGPPIEEPRGEDVKVLIADQLIDGVQEKLKEGWQPWGAPFQAGRDGAWLLQAMVKYQGD